MGFAMAEEFDTDAMPAPGRIKDRFSEVQGVLEDNASGIRGCGGSARSKGSRDLFGFVHQRQRGRGTDNPVACETQRDHGIRRVDIGLQITLFKFGAAVVEIGPGAKHRDAQSGNVGKVPQKGGALFGDDAQTGHADTWAIQSCRL